MVTTALLLSDLHEGVQTITFNRPDRLNALTFDMMAELGRLLDSATRDDRLRVVVLTGAGRAFSAGADVPALASPGESGPDPSAAPSGLGERVRTRLNPVITAIASLDKPVLAAVNGVAAGAGMSIALASDLRIAGRSARFVSAFVRVGLIPDGGSTHFLPRILGYERALRLAWTGDPLSADEALSLGLVGQVVEDAAVLSTAQELAARLAAGPTKTIALIKRAFGSPDRDALQRALEREAAYQEVASQSVDFAEGVRAFTEKRPPRFSGV